MTLREAAMPDAFTQLILFTDSDGRARFREQPITLSEGKPAVQIGRAHV